MTTTKEAAIARLAHAIKKAETEGDENLLEGIGWERIEYDGEVSYKFNYPSDLQRFAMIQLAQDHMNEARRLLEIASDYDGDCSPDVECADEIGMWWEDLAWIATAPDDLIVNDERIDIPCNFPMC